MVVPRKTACIYLLFILDVIFAARLPDGTLDKESDRKITLAQRRLYDCFAQEASGGNSDFGSLREKIGEKCRKHIDSLHSSIKHQLDGWPLLKHCKHGLFLLNPFDMYISHALSIYGEWSEPEVTLFSRFVPASGGLILDAGANVGAFSVPFSRMLGAEGLVVAVEPLRLNLQALCANVLSNLFGNKVIPLHAALGDVNSILSHVPPPTGFPDNFGGFSARCKMSLWGKQVQVVTVDSLRLPRLDLLKADVEGAETQVLRGAAKTIEQFKPVVYLEAERDAVQTAAGALLRGWGYHCRTVQTPLYNPGNHRGAAENIFGATSSYNMLCLHPDRHGPPEAPLPPPRRPICIGPSASTKGEEAESFQDLLCDSVRCFSPEGQEMRPADPRDAAGLLQLPGVRMYAAATTEGMTLMHVHSWRKPEVEDIIGKLVLRGWNILQVGQDSGGVVIPLARRVARRGGRIVVLSNTEVTTWTQNFRVLSANLAVNNLTNVHPVDLEFPRKSLPQDWFQTPWISLLPQWLRDGKADLIRIQADGNTTIAVFKAVLSISGNNTIKNGSKSRRPLIYMVDWCPQWRMPRGKRSGGRCISRGGTELRIAEAVLTELYQCYIHRFEHETWPMQSSTAQIAKEKSVNLLCAPRERMDSVNVSKVGASIFPFELPSNNASATKAKHNADHDGENAASLPVQSGSNSQDILHVKARKTANTSGRIEYGRSTTGGHPTVAGKLIQLWMDRIREAELTELRILVSKCWELHGSGQKLEYYHEQCKEVTDRYYKFLEDWLPKDGFYRLKRCRHGLFLLSVHDVYIAQSLDVLGEWSEGEVTDVFMQHIKPGSVVIDIGSNIGAFTVPLARLVGPSGRVYAFELDRLLHQNTCANAALNGFAQRVTCLHAGAYGSLGYVNHCMAHHVCANNFGGFSLAGRCHRYNRTSRKSEPHGSVDHVPLVTVDSLPLNRLDMIKIDVEGGEGQVLRGAAASIQRFQPVIYFEGGDSEESAAALIEHIKGLGPYECKKHEPLLYSQTNFNGRPDDGSVGRCLRTGRLVSSFNFLCISRTRQGLSSADGNENNITSNSTAKQSARGADMHDAVDVELALVGSGSNETLLLVQHFQQGLDSRQAHGPSSKAATDKILADLENEGADGTTHAGRSTTTSFGSVWRGQRRPWAAALELEREEVWRRFMPPARLALVVGAGIGEATLLLSRHLARGGGGGGGDGGLVLALEADPAAYVLLAAQCALNSLTNVFTLQVALTQTPQADLVHWENSIPGAVAVALRYMPRLLPPALIRLAVPAEELPAALDALSAAWPANYRPHPWEGPWWDSQAVPGLLPWPLGCPVLYIVHARGGATDAERRAQARSAPRLRALRCDDRLVKGGGGGGGGGGGDAAAAKEQAWRAGARSTKEAADSDKAEGGTEGYRCFQVSAAGRGGEDSRLDGGDSEAVVCVPGGQLGTVPAHWALVRQLE